MSLFRQSDRGFLSDLVLKLRLQVFAPGEWVVRRGDVGHQMYIVKSGQLHVMGEDNTTTKDILVEGGVFGEISLLNIPGKRSGNKRMASVKSVGYSDLFVLDKKDLWETLELFPEAKKQMEDGGVEILRNAGLLGETPKPPPTEEEKLTQRIKELGKSVDTKLINAVFLSHGK